eukprot:9343787-Pyramimonas_sp.AAC.1
MHRAPRPSRSVPRRFESAPERSGTDSSSSWPRPKMAGSGNLEPILAVSWRAHRLGALLTWANANL